MKGYCFKIVSVVVFVLFFGAANNFRAQEVNITQQLKMIEQGEINKARQELNKLKEEHSKDPSVLYLDALLTTEAKDAVTKYTMLSERYPKGAYADASLYKIYSYYYALGLYSQAKNILEKLTRSYPQSSYIKLAERKTSAEPYLEQINPQVQEKAIISENTVKEVSSGKIFEKNKVKYTIQAGAFLNIDNAKKLKEAFKDDGYSSDIKLKEVAGSTLSIVSVGSFSSEEEAKPILLLINERYKLNGRIIQSGQ